MDEKSFVRDLIKILSHDVGSRIYGSIEIFFEEGRITQITQRIISKVYKQEKVKYQTKSNKEGNGSEEITQEMTS